MKNKKTHFEKPVIVLVILYLLISVFPQKTHAKKESTTTINISVQKDNSKFTISSDPIPEEKVKSIIQEMLVKHLPYSESIYKPGGYFGNGQSTEHGARTNADYALIYSFLYKYCNNQSLPAGITIGSIKEHALAAIRYSYNTHKTGTLKCTDNHNWGLVWESSLWSTSTAYASWLMQDYLTESDKKAIKTLVVAEANYNLSRTIPTGVNSDTKAEENGWDTNILSVAACMYPEEKNAEAWDFKCKQFAMNAYSVVADTYRKDPVKDRVDGKTISEWYIGANLFPDYALENHDFFHTSYLNIPIQEMSESLLAYKVIQNQLKPVFPVPLALKHNVPEVWNTMLKELILADGELAMPNGNDWSMYIYDQLATYSALACIYRDPDALMLESITLQYARMRQSTTPDGAFLLMPDVAERRMAVIGHRLVFAYLYHLSYPTTGIIATRWDDFSQKHEQTKILPYSNIIRSNNQDRFVTFSWFQSVDGKSYKSYMGMVSPNSVNYSNIIFPYKTANTGNFTGYIDISGHKRNATLISNTYSMYPKSFSTTGKLSVTDGNMTQYLTFYSTPGNSIIYQEDMIAEVPGTILKDGGMLLGITTDTLTTNSRTLYSLAGSICSNGDSVRHISGNWVNIDNKFGMVVNGGNGIAFGEKELCTSINVSKLYGSYSTTLKTVASGDVVYSRSAIVYPKVDAHTTLTLASNAKYPTMEKGWKATAAEDPDGRSYVILSNFRSSANSSITLSYHQGAPVFDRVTTIINSTGTATFNCMPNTSVANELFSYIQTSTLPLLAVQGENPYSIYVMNPNKVDVPATISIWHSGKYKTFSTIIKPEACTFFQKLNGFITTSSTLFPGGYRNISRGKYIVANDQWPEHFPFATIDNIDSTYYQSLILPTAATPEELTLSLWGLYTCNKLNIKSVSGTGAKDIEIQTSMDRKTFTTVCTAILQNTTVLQTISFSNSKAKYVRLKVNSTYGTNNVGIAEIQLYGNPE
jgi:hypothetical protein